MTWCRFAISVWHLHRIKLHRIYLPTARWARSSELNKAKVWEELQDVAVDSVVAVDLMTKLLKLSMTALDLAKCWRHHRRIKYLPFYLNELFSSSANVHLKTFYYKVTSSVSSITLIMSSINYSSRPIFSLYSSQKDKKHKDVTMVFFVMKYTSAKDL